MTLLPPHMYSVADKIGYIHTYKKKKNLITTFSKLPNHDLRLSTSTDKKIQMKAF